MASTKRETRSTLEQDSEVQDMHSSVNNHLRLDVEGQTISLLSLL